MSAVKVIPGDNASSPNDNTGARSHRKQAKGDVIRQVITSPASPAESRDSSSDDGDVDVNDSVSLPR